MRSIKMFLSVLVLCMANIALAVDYGIVVRDGTTGACDVAKSLEKDYSITTVVTAMDKSKLGGYDITIEYNNQSAENSYEFAIIAVEDCYLKDESTFPDRLTSLSEVKQKYHCKKTFDPEKVSVSMMFGIMGEDGGTLGPICNKQ